MSSVLLGASSSSRLSKGIQQRKNIKMPKVVQQVFESSDEDGTMERAPTASSNQPQPAAAAAPGSGSRKPRSLHPHAPPAAVDAPAAASSSSSKKRKRFVAPATPSKYSSYELFGTDSEDEDNIHDRVRKTDEPAEKKVKKHSSSPSSSLCTSGGCEPQKTKTKCTNDYVSSAGPSSSFSSRSVKRTSARDVFGADSDDDDDDHIEAKAGRSPAVPMPSTSQEAERIIPPPTLPDPILPPKPIEPYKPEEHNFPIRPLFDRPPFLPPRPIPHSPKISPSSIPNPSPSVTTTKHVETGYPSYSGYLYSIPGYSAFQPVNYSGMLPQPSIPTTETSSDFTPFPSMPNENAENNEFKPPPPETQSSKEIPKPQTDFEEQFTPEIIPAVSVPDSIKSINENKMSITSLAQGSGATVTIPSQICNKDVNKKKPLERFSLKTSIPISKIDMKCVGNPPEAVLSTTMAKKPATFNPAFSTKSDSGPKVEIQSNIIIKSAIKEPEITETPAISTHNTINNISNLLTAAEVVNKNDNQFRKPEPKVDVINEIKDPPPNFVPPNSNITRPVLTVTENNKVNIPPKPPDGNFNEQKNQILFIQNKNQNPKMLLTIQQQNPQVLLQRANFDSKNAQVPSRLSSQKKSKDDVSENGTSSKVVALKRLHQENCDENDFENLITENQIYGNKIVVKEKSQGTLHEQDLKSKNKVEKPTQETKNVVLQSNFVYLSNVQFPANLMMIKNNPKVSQPTDQNKMPKVTSNENKVTTISTMTNSSDINATKNNKSQNVTVSKEIHVLKSSNNVLQSLSNKNSKSDIVFQSHQKVIMNPQIVYQVPMIVDADNKINQPFMNREYPKLIGQHKKEYTNLEQKPNEKLYIACPYQMDSKLQPKIVITNIRPKMPKVDEVSSLDLYEKRKRLRRLKYLSNRETKDIQKADVKKVPEKIDCQRNIITPNKIEEEICKEFTNTKVTVDEGSSGSESDYGENDLEEYERIIKDLRNVVEKKDDGKADFLAHFRLASHKVYKEKELDRRERIIRRDSVASAYISAGRIDRLTDEDNMIYTKSDTREIVSEKRVKIFEQIENGVTLQKKQMFLSQLKLKHVTQQYKEGYEKTWLEILKERNRRDGGSETKQILKQPRLETEKRELDPNGQLRILTEIKKSVNENNNLIKKRLDSTDSENMPDGDTIHTLAEKNFSELNRLSKIADISVKLITGQDTRKRDLNPGFDSENIKKQELKADQPLQNYSHINIPSVTKIISLKSDVTTQGTAQVTCQATSMDEPVNSAAGLDVVEVDKRDFTCQVEETMPWPGVWAAVKSYWIYDTARKKEINDLHRRNTALRVDGAHITRKASRDSDRARALLAERQHLTNDEASVRQSLQKLMAAIEFIKNC